MGGALSGSRIALVTIVLAVLITAGFHSFYPDVAITPGLQLEFVVAAALCGLAAEALLRAVGRMRQRRNTLPVAPATGKDEGT